VTAPAPETRPETMVVVRKSDRGAMASGGTVAHEVYVDGRWVGWCYDARRFTGFGFGGRTWSATWREDDDTAARWTTEGHRTRAAAVEALVEHVRGGRTT
jgi:hypothetical protein